MAGVGDPLRGVAPGRVDILATRGSGVSAMAGLVLVGAVLLLAGGLAVSGGGFLDRGGQLVGLAAEPAGSPTASTDVPPGSPDTAAPTSAADPPSPGAGEGSQTVGAVDPAAQPTPIGASTDYSCGRMAIRDPEASKWALDSFVAGTREGFDRVSLVLARRGKAEGEVVVRGEWLTPREAAARYGIARPTGGRALVLTLEGDVELDADQTIDAPQLDAEGVAALRSVHVFSDRANGVTRAVIGLRGEGCARLASREWNKQGRDRRAVIWVDVQAS